ncbi:hypothetical protein JHK82_043111 [Glycine max]|nr:hypothetical protein JHK82_043111 [Glycine max]
MSTMYGNVTYVPRTFYANREEMLKSYAESVAGNDGFALWFGDIVQAFSTIELSTSPNSMQMDVSRSKGSHLKILVSNEGAGDSVALLGNEKMECSFAHIGKYPGSSLGPRPRFRCDEHPPFVVHAPSPISVGCEGGFLSLLAGAAIKAVDHLALTSALSPLFDHTITFLICTHPPSLLQLLKKAIKNLESMTLEELIRILKVHEQELA